MDSKTFVWCFLSLYSGERIVLEKNMRYFLPRSAIEHLVRQGLLQEV